MLKKIILLSAICWLFSYPAAADSQWKNEFALGQSDEWYGTDEAIRIAENVLLYQRNSGGWPKNIEMHEVLTESQKQQIAAQKNELSCFDNGATTTEMRFLAKVYRRIPDPRYIKAFCDGLQCILEAQSLCGSGWPQYWPKRGGNAGSAYSDFITFNDNVTTNILQMLQDVLNNSGDFAGIADEDIYAKARTSFEKGLQCILDCQIRDDDGNLTVWCAQHHPETLLPAVGRNYEMPSYSGCESANILKFLMRQKNPSEAIKKAVEGGMRWFENYAINDMAVVDVVNSHGEKDQKLVKAEGKRLWGRFVQIGGKTGQQTYTALIDFLEEYGGTRKYNINGKTCHYKDADNARNSYDPSQAGQPILCPKTQELGCAYRFAYNFNDTEPEYDANGVALPTSLSRTDRTTYSFLGTWGESLFDIYEEWKAEVCKETPDTTEPFGWAACSNPDGAPYKVDGGWRYPTPTSIVLYASGGDDMDAIYSAIKEYDIIVFDGSKGDFIVSRSMNLDGLKNKSLLGRNNARICTQWYITPEIKAALEAANLHQYSTKEGTGGTLSNGMQVGEECELKTRQLLIDILGDEKEQYRKSGLFSFYPSNENIIIRNLSLVGPGAIDVGGGDLISNNGGTHMWIDHCDFIDGMDGNLDSGKRDISDQFVTYSWNKFRYTERSLMHAFSNGNGWGRGYIQHVTFAYNIWGEGCKLRLPDADNVCIHMLNNYYACQGNMGGIYINDMSRALLEGNYAAEGVNNAFKPGLQDSMFFVSRDNIGFGEFDNARNTSISIEMPYAYTRIQTERVPEVLSSSTGAGPTLPDDFFTLPEQPGMVVYAVSEHDVFKSGETVTRPNITLTYSEEGGPDFRQPIEDHYDGTFTHYCPGNEVNGNNDGGTFYVFKPKKNGSLTTYIRHNLKKPLYVLEDNIALPEYNGITYDESHPSSYPMSFDVKGGSTYRLYCSGSKLGFYGFIYKWDDTTGISTTTVAPSSQQGIYNLCGQKLEKPQKGINIIGGKKVIIRI